MIEDTTIISLLSLQSRQMKDKNVLAAIRESQNRVRAMALVHEKISPSEHISEIDITDYIRFLGKYLFQFYEMDKGYVRLVLEGACIKVGINTAIPLGLVINEMISNSLKHAFPGGRSGKITIHTEQCADGIIVRISDNGIGLSEHPVPEKSGSLGIMLIHNLSDQLGASICLDHTGGTTYTITIPHDRIRRHRRYRACPVYPGMSKLPG